MNLRISRLPAIAAFALAGVLGVQSLAQNAYITNASSNTVSVIDTATNAMIGAPIPVGFQPLGVAVPPDGSKVFVANAQSNTVSVIVPMSANAVCTQTIYADGGYSVDGAAARPHR